VRPAGLDQQLRLRGAGEAGQQQCRAGGVCPLHQHLAGVRVRRAGLGVQVVAVVPDHQQARVDDRREHHRPGAHHHPHLAAPHRQPAAVAPRRPEVGAQRHHALAQQRGAGGVHAFDIAVVGQRQHRPAARGRRGRRRLG
jgi:hypothetical protein